MEPETRAVNTVAEALSSSRAHNCTLGEEATTSVVLPDTARGSRPATHDRVLGTTDATSDKPITTTTDQLNATTDSHTSPTQATPTKLRTQQERRTPSSTTRPPISTAGTCHPCGVAGTGVTSC